MRILMVITGLGVGGAERLVTGLADHFADVGHEVLLVRFFGDAELRPSDPRVRLENLQMRRSPLGVLAAMVRFRRLVCSFRPDVVNSHMVHPNILTRLLRLVTPMPRLVSSAHNTNEQGRGRMLAYRLTDRLADISTNVSDEAVEAFKQQGALRPGRMVTIHNGIDTAAFTFDPAARERVRAELSLDRPLPCCWRWGACGSRKTTLTCCRPSRAGRSGPGWRSSVTDPCARNWRPWLGRWGWPTGCIFSVFGMTCRR